MHLDIRIATDRAITAGAYPLTSAAPAAALVRDLWAQAHEALRRLASHVPRP
jgi:hypothetical protein